MFYVLGTDNCPFCHHAKELLREKNLPFQSYDLDDHPLLRFMLHKSNLKTVPQIWHDGEYIGGYTELKEFTR